MLLAYVPRQAWDLAVDICLSQLPTIIEEGTAFRVSLAPPLPYPILPPSHPAPTPLPLHPPGFSLWVVGKGHEDLCTHVFVLSKDIPGISAHLCLCYICDYVFV